MSRTPRSHLPGAVFHLTARTQGHEPWFTDAIRSRIVEFTAAAIGVSDAALLAYAIMTNHLHLVLRQGEWPLERVMQPLLRRIASLVQRATGREGHVFERRFRDRPCLDPDHVRSAIVYSHLNPVRAGLVSHPGGYQWTSHRAYRTHGGGPACMVPALKVESALGLFSRREDACMDELRGSYASYVAWRLRCDRHHAAEKLGLVVGTPPPPPPFWSGDIWWSRTFTPLVHPTSRANHDGQVESMPRRPDLRDIAKQTLAEHSPFADLERVRSNCKERVVVRLRSAMIHRMSDAGYSGRAMARYLRVSDQCVSHVLAKRRAVSRSR
jgi:REP element-mobilizing transposase RayT